MTPSPPSQIVITIIDEICNFIVIKMKALCNHLNELQCTVVILNLKYVPEVKHAFICTQKICFCQDSFNLFFFHCGKNLSILMISCPNVRLFLDYNLHKNNSFLKKQHYIRFVNRMVETSKNHYSSKTC